MHVVSVSVVCTRAEGGSVDIDVDVDVDMSSRIVS